jgi:hypothetical protein
MRERERERDKEKWRSQIECPYIRVSPVANLNSALIVQCLLECFFFSNFYLTLKMFPFTP